MRDPIQRFVDRLQREHVMMHGFLLSAGGEEKAKAYYAPFCEGAPHRLYSVSKTMTGLAIGMLLDEGKLRLTDPVTDYFPDLLPDCPDPRLTALKLRDMLRMATCYQHTAYKEGVDADWTRPFFTGTPTHEPGTVFHYDTGCAQVLAALVRRLSGQEVMDFLEDRLFGPLGCEDRRWWLRDPSGCCQGGTGLCMSLRDLHKVALCLLDGGRGLVPGWFVAEMRRKQIDTPLQPHEEERYGYGWQCWQTRCGWSMYGMGGQLAIFCEEQRAVLTTIADTRLDPEGVQHIYNAFYDELYPCLSGLPSGTRTLRLAVQPLPDQPGCQINAAGPYRFSPGNQLGLHTLSLTPEGLVYENAHGAVHLPFAAGQVLTVPYPGHADVPALVTAGWFGPRLLRVQCHAIGDAPCGFDMVLCFDDRRVTVQCRASSDPLTRGYTGVASGTAEKEGC